MFKSFKKDKHSPRESPRDTSTADSGTAVYASTEGTPGPHPVPHPETYPAFSGKSHESKTMALGSEPRPTWEPVPGAMPPANTKPTGGFVNDAVHPTATLGAHTPSTTTTTPVSNVPGGDASFQNKMLHQDLGSGPALGPNGEKPISMRARETGQQIAAGAAVVGEKIKRGAGVAGNKVSETTGPTLHSIKASTARAAERFGKDMEARNLRYREQAREAMEQRAAADEELARASRRDVERTEKFEHAMEKGKHEDRMVNKRFDAMDDLRKAQRESISAHRKEQSLIRYARITESIATLMFKIHDSLFDLRPDTSSNIKPSDVKRRMAEERRAAIASPGYPMTSTTHGAVPITSTTEPSVTKPGVFVEPISEPSMVAQSNPHAAKMASYQNRPGIAEPKSRTVSSLPRSS